MKFNSIKSVSILLLAAFTMPSAFAGALCSDDNIRSLAGKSIRLTRPVLVDHGAISAPVGGGQCQILMRLTDGANYRRVQPRVFQIERVSYDYNYDATIFHFSGDATVEGIRCPSYIMSASHSSRHEPQRVYLGSSIAAFRSYVSPTFALSDRVEPALTCHPTIDAYLLGGSQPNSSAVSDEQGPVNVPVPADVAPVSQPAAQGTQSAS